MIKNFIVHVHKLNWAGIDHAWLPNISLLVCGPQTGTSESAVVSCRISSYCTRSSWRRVKVCRWAVLATEFGPRSAYVMSSVDLEF